MILKGLLVGMVDEQFISAFQWYPWVHRPIIFKQSLSLNSICVSIHCHPPEWCLGGHPGVFIHVRKSPMSHCVTSVFSMNRHNDLASRQVEIPEYPPVWSQPMEHQCDDCDVASSSSTHWSWLFSFLGIDNTILDCNTRGNGDSTSESGVQNHETNMINIKVGIPYWVAVCRLCFLNTVSTVNEYW